MPPAAKASYSRFRNRAELKSGRGVHKTKNCAHLHCHLQFYLRILVYLVIYDSWCVSLEQVLLSWYACQSTLRLSSYLRHSLADNRAPLTLNISQNEWETIFRCPIPRPDLTFSNFASLESTRRPGPASLKTEMAVRERTCYELDTSQVDMRLPGKGNSSLRDARPVHLIITMIKWIRTSALSIKKCLSMSSMIYPFP